MPPVVFKTTAVDFEELRVCDPTTAAYFLAHHFHRPVTPQNSLGSSIWADVHSFDNDEESDDDSDHRSCAFTWTDSSTSYTSESSSDIAPLPDGSDTELPKKKTTEPVTTVKFSNIAYRRGINEIVEVIHSLGFENTYDMLYTPYKNVIGKKIVNKGFALINFKSEADASAFMAKASEAIFPNSQSTKVPHASPAVTQGLSANVHAHRKQRLGAMMVCAADGSLCLFDFSAPNAQRNLRSYLETLSC